MSEELEHVSVLRLRPDDVLVYRSQKRISRDRCETIKAVLTSRFPDHVVMVVDEGADLAVIRKEEE